MKIDGLRADSLRNSDLLDQIEKLKLIEDELERVTTIQQLETLKSRYETIHEEPEEEPTEVLSASTMQVRKRQAERLKLIKQLKERLSVLEEQQAEPTKLEKQRAALKQQEAEVQPRQTVSSMIQEFKNSTKQKKPEKSLYSQHEVEMVALKRQHKKEIWDLQTAKTKRDEARHFSLHEIKKEQDKRAFQSSLRYSLGANAEPIIQALEKDIEPQTLPVLKGSSRLIDIYEMEKIAREREEQRQILLSKLDGNEEEYIIYYEEATESDQTRSSQKASPMHLPSLSKEEMKKKHDEDLLKKEQQRKEEQRAKEEKVRKEQESKEKQEKERRLEELRKKEEIKKLEELKKQEEQMQKKAEEERVEKAKREKQQKEFEEKKALEEKLRQEEEKNLKLLESQKLEQKQKQEDMEQEEFDEEVDDGLYSFLKVQMMMGAKDIPSNLLQQLFDLTNKQQNVLDQKQGALFQQMIKWQ